MTQVLRHERVYRAMLRAYPSRFRTENEQELLRIYRDQQRDGVAEAPGYWPRLIVDVLRSAPREWRDEITTTFQAGGVSMRGLAVVAVLVGAFELFNTFTEIRAGGFNSRDALAQAGLVLALISMIALAAAGVALLRSGRAATRFAQVAAACCIASFAFIGLTRPSLSVLAMILGIGFPVLLLGWAMMSGRNTPASVA